MEYNSSREELVIPEYGRHVQGLIRYARNIADNNERQHFIERVIGLMMQMHPQNRNLEDYTDKLWRHVFQIAEYDLNVTTPSGEIPTPDIMHKKPERVNYPIKNTKFKHYGNNVQKLIARAIEMEEGPKKDGFVQVIGSYMKLAYRTWNKEHYVSDDVIIEDLESLSKGKLALIEDASLDNLTRSNQRRSSSSNRGSDRGGDSRQQRYQNGAGRNSGGSNWGGDRDRGGRQQQQRRRRKK